MIITKIDVVCALQLVCLSGCISCRDNECFECKCMVLIRSCCTPGSVWCWRRSGGNDSGERVHRHVHSGCGDLSEDKSGGDGAQGGIHSLLVTLYYSLQLQAYL